jgi:hypothetical protein
MSISTVSVPVPLSGEGALVDVSALVGAKTVVLTGRFKGIYELLASQDDSHFVPVLLFDAGGVEVIRQTIAGSFKSVRARAATPGTIPLGVVTCEVSAIAAAGENRFAVLANLAAGFIGLSPVLDTAVLFPPSGPETDICFICRGALQGLLAIEGSLDGLRFSPIGSWRVDRLPEGAPTVLELTPLTTQDKTRYLRISLNGSVGAGGVVITIGGRVPASSTLGNSISPIEEASGRLTTLGASGEEILYEEPIDLDTIAAGTILVARWSAVISALAASVATFRVYVGSTTPGNTAGGTVRATLSTGSPAPVITSVVGAAFANPGGQVLMQITGINDTPATRVSQMYSFSLRMV